MNNTKILFILAGLLFFKTPIASSYHKEYTPLSSEDALFDGHTDTDLPYKFNALPNVTISQKANLKGFRNMRISGSGQFSEQQFKKMLKNLKDNFNVSPEKLIVLDLRREQHGFINNIPVQWYISPFDHTHTQSSQETLKNETQHFEQLKEKSNLTIYERVKSSDGSLLGKDAIIITINHAHTEEELMTELGIGYKRIPTTDHLKPSPENIDDFMDFLKTVPEDTWIHFHCHGGKGRRTTYMVLYDIMHNPEVSLDDILHRHALAGEKNLNKKHMTPNEQWEKPMAKARYQEIVLFYEYVHDPEGLNSIKWSEWLTQKYPQN